MLLIRLLLGLMVSIFFLAGCGKGKVCDEDTARLVARAYVLSIPVFGREDELVPLIKENHQYFVESGKAIVCMQAVGNALTTQALSMSSSVPARSATEMFGSMPPGLEHLPGQVDSSLQSYSSNNYAMALEFIWLAQVLPPVTLGNYVPYRSTGTPNRQMAAQTLPVFRLLCQMDPQFCNSTQNILNQMQPMLEQQIYGLVVQF